VTKVTKSCGAPKGAVPF